MRKVVLAALALASCGRLRFDALDGPPGGGSGGDAARGDGAAALPDGPVASGCTSPGDPEPFDTGGAGCDTWGTASTGGVNMIGESNGELVITFGTDFAASGAFCTEVGTVSLAIGAFVEVGAAPPAVTTSFAAVDATNGTQLDVNCSGGTIAYSLSGSGTVTVPYDAIAMRWWRLRTDPATGTDTLFETAPDGITWTARASQPYVMAAGQASLAASGFGMNTGTMVKFEGVDVCPP